MVSAFAVCLVVLHSTRVRGPTPPSRTSRALCAALRRGRLFTSTRRWRRCRSFSGGTPSSACGDHLNCRVFLIFRYCSWRSHFLQRVHACTESLVAVSCYRLPKGAKYGRQPVPVHGCDACSDLTGSGPSRELAPRVTHSRATPHEAEATPSRPHVPRTLRHGSPPSPHTLSLPVHWSRATHTARPLCHGTSSQPATSSPFSPPRHRRAWSGPFPPPPPCGFRIATAALPC